MEHTIIREIDGKVDVIIGEKIYQLIEDEHSGDWLVACGDDPMVQSDWMVSRGDAIIYALDRGGVIEDGNYERAPERTSA